VVKPLKNTKLVKKMNDFKKFTKIAKETFLKHINQCKTTSVTRTDREMCLKNVNDQVLDFLHVRYGDNTLGCVGRMGMKHNRFGVFLVETLDKTGQGFGDVKKFNTPICRRGSNVLSIETDDGKKIFFKTSGTTGQISAPEIMTHQESVNIANAIREDVPIMLHSNPNTGIVAIEGIKGHKVGGIPSKGERIEYMDYDDAPPLEKAESLLFETAIASFDRTNNILRDGDVVKEIDFDDTGNHNLMYSSILSGTNLHIVRSIENGENIEPELKRAIESQFDWYWKNRGNLKVLAPTVFNEPIVSGRIKHLSEKLGIQYSEDIKELMDKPPIIPKHDW